MPDPPPTTTTSPICDVNQVQPHPCDKDYQHAQGLLGCSPSFIQASASARRSAVGLVNMDKLLRIRLPRGSEHGTHAQTLLRSGYMNMLGRPPFEYADGTDYRKAGFMSTQRLLDARDQTIFRPCKTVKQCFEDRFTHHGQEVTRRVFVKADSIGAIDAGTGARTVSFMRDWLSRDASKCGIFGFWLVDQNDNPVNDKCSRDAPSTTHYCCALDMAVNPLFYMFMEHPDTLDELDAVCNRAPSDLPSSAAGGSAATYQIFSKSRVENILAIFKDGYYAVPMQESAAMIRQYTELLNGLTNEFSPPAGRNTICMLDSVAHMHAHAGQIA